MKPKYTLIRRDKRLFAFLLLPLLLTVSYVSCASTPPPPAGIKVGIIGDQTGTADLGQAYTVLQQGVQLLTGKDIQVVIHVGDLLESRESESEIRNQFSQATTILDQLPVNWYMTAGDHDVNPPTFQQDSSDRTREALFQELYGARVPAVLQNPYYSFDVGNHHFIALYSHESLHADPRWGNIFLSEVSDQQFDWLANDLAANKDAEAIIVFIHQPLWYNWSAWARVHRLLKRYKVAAVVAGHFHYDQREGTLDGIRYAVVGATGGTVKQGDRDAGNVQHVSVMHVKGRQRVNFELFSLSDNLPLRLTPRKVMDKVQALDIVLGELWNFAATNPVFIKNGTLVNDCDSTDPAVINIAPIGNPTDDTIKVDIGFSSSDPNVVIASAGFAPGECANVINDYECELARSARIFFANLSSVSVNPYVPPLWTAVLGTTATPPQSGAALNFDVRLTYPTRSGTTYLERQVTTTLDSCPLI